MALVSKRSRRWVTHRVTMTSSGVQWVREVVPVRAHQLIRLWGYSMGIAMNSALDDDNEGLQAVLRLSTLKRELSLSFVGIQDEGGLPRASDTVIDQWFLRRVMQFDTEGRTWTDHVAIQPWVYTDLLVPEIALYMHGIATTIVDVDAGGWVNVEYEYVNATPGQIAAVNFHWGRDPQDVTLS